jgi:hypothetical protein
MFSGVMTRNARAERLVPGKGARGLYSTEAPAAEDAALVVLPLPSLRQSCTRLDAGSGSSSSRNRQPRDADPCSYPVRTR